MATLYVGSDQTYKTLQEAINAASATEATTIVISAGTYAEDITLDARSMEQKGDLKFVAAEDAEVTITGLVTIGYYEKRVGSKKWDAAVSISPNSAYICPRTNDFHESLVGNPSINLNVFVRQLFAIADHMRNGATNATSSVL